MRFAQSHMEQGYNLPSDCDLPYVFTARRLPSFDISNLPLWSQSYPELRESPWSGDPGPAVSAAGVWREYMTASHFKKHEAQKLFTEESMLLSEGELRLKSSFIDPQDCIIHIAPLELEGAKLPLYKVAV